MPVVYDGFTWVPLTVEIRVDEFYPLIIHKGDLVRQRREHGGRSVVENCVSGIVVGSVRIRIVHDVLRCIPVAVAPSFVILDSRIISRGALACRVN